MADSPNAADADLTKRLLQCVREWGRSRGAGGDRLGEETVEALLKTVVGICVFRALGAMEITAEQRSEAFRLLEREEPLDEEMNWLLRVQARKAVLVRNLRRAVDAF